MKTHSDAALLIAGHGSTLNAYSSIPTFEQADLIREKNLFAEVHTCFWKEEPNFRQALNQIEASRVYVVPHFISSGYFTEEVIPRELGLDGPITTRGSQEIYYCKPVGLHPSMTSVLLKKAEEVVTASGHSLKNLEKSACLMICGHGTSLNENSTKIIHEQVDRIRSLKCYAECQAIFMEQKPFVQNWKKLTQQPQVIIIPFFISDGLHSYEDIPALLGFLKNSSSSKEYWFHSQDGRSLWYGTAIGTHPTMADVILAQVDEFDENYRSISKMAS